MFGGRTGIVGLEYRRTELFSDWPVERALVSNDDDDEDDHIDNTIRSENGTNSYLVKAVASAKSEF